MKKNIALLILILLITNINNTVTYAHDTNCNPKPLHAYTDHHVHMMSEEFSEVFKTLLGTDTYIDIPIEEVSGEKIVSLLDEANMNKAFVLSNSYIYGMDQVQDSNEYENVKKENNYLANEVAKYPDRLIGFFSVNPLKDYAISEIDRCYDELGLSGLKLHFTNSDVDLRNPDHLIKIKQLFTHVSEKGIPILLHFRSRSPEFGKEDAEILIDNVISEIPNLKLQIAHLGGWGSFDRSAKEVFATFIEKYNSNPYLKKENIYFDISGVIVTDREKELGLDVTTEEDLKKLARMLKEWGLDNIVFGTDYQYQTQTGYLEYMKTYLPLANYEIQNILNNDLSKIFFNCEQ